VFQIKFAKKAFKDFERITSKDAKIGRVIQEHIAKLPGTYKHDEFLKGPFAHYRKHRVGDYRVIYEVLNQTLVILVIRIGHRREVYN